MTGYRLPQGKGCIDIDHIQHIYLPLEYGDRWLVRIYYSERVLIYFDAKEDAYVLYDAITAHMCKSSDDMDGLT